VAEEAESGEDSEEVKGDERDVPGSPPLQRPRDTGEDDEKKGYRPDEYGRWKGLDGDVALPLYEGRMIGQFDFSEKGWVSGKGRTAKWREIPFDQKTLEPQYLMAQTTYLSSEKSIRGNKIAIMNITSATNARSVVGSWVRDYPCNHSLNPTRLAGASLVDQLAFLALINSFVFDYIIRMRLGGINLSEFILNETALPVAIPLSVKHALALWAAKLTFSHRSFAPEWLALRRLFADSPSPLWSSLWAVSASQRLEMRCAIDAVSAGAFGLNLEDLAYILQDDPSDSKGFWRVDQDLPVEQRLTSLALKAFEHLKQVGLDEFCQRGWELPDYARTYDRPGVKTWTPTEDWPDCERHARNILGEEGFTRFMANLSGQESEQSAQPSPHVAGPSPTYTPSTPGAQRRLFPGEATLFGDPMEDLPPRAQRKK